MRKESKLRGYAFVILYNFMNKSSNFFLKKRFTPITAPTQKSASFSRAFTTKDNEQQIGSATTSPKQFSKSQLSMSPTPMKRFIKTRQKPSTAHHGLSKRRYHSIEREEPRSSKNNQSAMVLSVATRKKSRKYTAVSSDSM